MDSHDFSGAAEHEALKAAFSATSYEAFGLGQEFSLRVDRNHPDLDALLLTTAREPWAFLTAWNPRSTPTGKSQNIAANQALAKQLAQLTDQAAAWDRMRAGRPKRASLCWESHASRPRPSASNSASGLGSQGSAAL